MSIDDQHRELVNFRRALGVFDEALAGSFRKMEVSHDAVSPLWRDERRRSYDSEWEPLREMLERYITVESKHYESFLDEKIQQVRRYLHGG